MLAGALAGAALAGAQLRPAPRGAAGAPIASIEALAWLAGHWVQQDEHGRTEELWLPGHPARPEPLVRSAPDGAERAQVEFLRIAEDAGELVYFASPSDAPATPFRLVELDGERAVFANPAHDGGPKRIEYRRSGATLCAAALGDDGKGPAWTFELAGAFDASGAAVAR